MKLAAFVDALGQQECRGERPDAWFFDSDDLRELERDVGQSTCFFPPCGPAGPPLNGGSLYGVRIGVLQVIGPSAGKP